MIVSDRLAVTTRLVAGSVAVTRTSYFPAASSGSCSATYSRTRPSEAGRRSVLHCILVAAAAPRTIPSRCSNRTGRPCAFASRRASVTLYLAVPTGLTPRPYTSQTIHTVEPDFTVRVALASIDRSSQRDGVLSPRGATLCATSRSDISRESGDQTGARRVSRVVAAAPRVGAKASRLSA